MQSQNPSSSKTWIKTSMNLPKYPTKSFTIHHPTQKKILAHIKYTHFFTKSLRFAHLFWSKTSLSYSESHGIFGRPRTSRCFGAPPRSLQFSRCSKPSIHSREDAAGLGFTGKSPWLKKKHLTFEI